MSALLIGLLVVAIALDAVRIHYGRRIVRNLCNLEARTDELADVVDGRLELVDGRLESLVLEQRRIAAALEHQAASLRLVFPVEEGKPGAELPKFKAYHPDDADEVRDLINRVRERDEILLYEAEDALNGARRS